MYFQFNSDTFVWARQVLFEYPISRNSYVQFVLDYINYYSIFAIADVMLYTVKLLALPTCYDTCFFKEKPPVSTKEQELLLSRLISWCCLGAHFFELILIFKFGIVTSKHKQRAYP
jgi:hypothetical protein